MNKLPSHLFWDMDLEKFDIHKGRALVAERIAERGTLQDLHIMINLYGGIDEVRNIYKNEVKHLDKYALSLICALFNIKQEEMQCCIKKRLREALLNS
ncbi:hypothetical protein AGMMS49938_16360 [Fibrobacterales bacterium]|nr:hypothetical protein AGMMS49938_16360 [Fibrobacterales bacterium]